VFPAALLSLLSVVYADTVPAGTEIEDALHVDITPAGLDSMGALVPGLAPEDLPVDGISEGYEGVAGECWLGGYEVTVSDLVIGLDFDDINITPNTGYLDTEIKIYVNVNSSAEPFSLYTELACLPSDCDGWVEPFEVNAYTEIALDVVVDDDGTERLDATIGELTIDYALTGDDVYLEGCPLGTVLDVFDFIGLDLVDLILPVIGDTLNDAVADFGPELETTLEDAFSAASIDQELEVQDSTLHLAIRPGDVVIQPTGMRLTMTGLAEAAEISDCIAEWDAGGFEAIPGSSPDIGAPADGIDPAHAANLMLSDEFGNQLMYALWQSGLLCYTVDDDLGFPIDTSLLGILAGESFNTLFAEAKPMVIQTRPQQAPRLEFAASNDIGLIVDDLGLDFMAELDHRNARVLAIGLEVDGGLDVGFDDTTGQLAIAIDLDAESFNPSVTSNDFVPDSTDTIEESFASVFNGLVGGLLGDALSDITFTVPGIEGIGITGMQIESTGPEEDWLGAYVWLGEVSYASTGCSDGEGGCGGGEDGGGCTAGPRSQRRWGLLLFPLFVALLRRRED
jgi:hypothetical protein